MKQPIEPGRFLHFGTKKLVKILSLAVFCTTRSELVSSPSVLFFRLYHANQPLYDAYEAIIPSNEQPPARIPDGDRASTRAAAIQKYAPDDAQRQVVFLRGDDSFALGYGIAPGEKSRSIARFKILLSTSLSDSAGRKGHVALDRIEARDVSAARSVIWLVIGAPYPFGGETVFLEEVVETSSGVIGAVRIRRGPPDGEEGEEGVAVDVEEFSLREFIDGQPDTAQPGSTISE